MKSKKGIFITVICSLLSHTLFAQGAPAKDFSFVTGSCAYLNRSQEDKEGVKYEGDTSIFYSLSKMDADFMLWLGDNWYLDEIETRTVEGLRNKAKSQRSSPLLQRISKAMPEYAIWDDHDYGPNNAGIAFPLKEESRNIFIDTWKNNPSFGEDNKGVYTSFHHGDALFILLDARWWRSDDKDPDYLFSLKTIPNGSKKMLGDQQMKWLKELLLKDTSRFKIIVNGSQVLNPLAKGDCLIHFPVEYADLLSFIHNNHVNGILFLSGDRHFSEIIGLKRKDDYPLYDITVSSLTASTDHPRGREKHNKYRVKGSLIEAYNYAQFSFSGTGKNRALVVTYFNKNGKPFYHWGIKADDLVYGKKN